MSAGEILATAALFLAKSPLLTKQDLAEHYRVTDRCIEKWVAVGRLPKPRRREGKTPLWAADDILRRDFQA